jgi:hypothetical protein
MTKSLLQGYKAISNDEKLIPLRDGDCAPSLRHDAEASPDSDEEQSEDTSLLRLNAWTRIHSHFALMERFAFEAQTEDGPTFSVDGRTLATMTPLGLQKIAKGDTPLLPDISEFAIREKSKANRFAKFLVCLQATWFVVQTVGRLSVRLPISLLETNSLLHAVFCIYVAWRHKPLDIEESYIIIARNKHAESMRVDNNERQFVSS